MKKAILTLALIMSIGATQVSLASSAPKHRYHPTTQQVDKQAAAGQASADQDDEAIAAYSDTTATDTSDYADVDDNDNRAYHSKYSLGNYDDPSISSVRYLVAERCRLSSSSVSSSVCCLSLLR